MSSTSFSSGPTFTQPTVASVGASSTSNIHSRTGDPTTTTLPVRTMFSDMAYGPTFLKSLDELSSASAALAASAYSSSSFGGDGGDLGLGVGGGRMFRNGGNGDIAFNSTNMDGAVLSGTRTGANSSAANFLAEASAYRLLAREGGGFDAASLGRATRELKYKLQKSAATSQREQGDGRNGKSFKVSDKSQRIGTNSDHPLNIDQFLQKDLEGTIFSNLREPREKAVRESTNIMRETMDEMFKRDTERFLEQRGYRSFENSGAGAHRDRSTAFSSLPTFQQPQLYIPITFGSHDTFSSVVATDSIHAPLDDFSRRHAALVCELNTSAETQTSSFSAKEFLDELERLSEEWASRMLSSDGAGDKEAFTGYVTSLNLLGSMFQLKESGTTGTQLSNPLSLGAGTLKHITRLYQNDISQSVSEAFRAGRITDNSGGGDFRSMSSTAQDVYWYIQFKMMGPVRGGSSGFNSSSALLWPKIYTCLQCGDAMAALQIIQYELRRNSDDRQSAQVEPCVNEVLSHLARFQSSSSTDGNTNDFVWASVLSPGDGNGIPSSMPILDIPDNVQKNLNELFRASKQKYQQESISAVDRYKLSTLALLVQDMNEDISNLNVEETIEDYLFTKLWMIVSGSVYESSRGSRTLGSVQASSISAKSLISELGATIKHWGPNYFEGEDTTNRSEAVVAGGWAYASPLLMCQQFSSALYHLASRGGMLGVLQATHLAIVFDAANVPIVDFGVSSKTKDDGTTGEDDGRLLYGSLLRSYSNSIKDSDPPAALEYLIRFPDNLFPGNSSDSYDINSETKRMEIANLILSTGAYDVLVGSLSANGTRELNVPDGRILSSAVMSAKLGRRNIPAVDAHFSPSEVSSLLEETADMALREDRLEDAAELLSRSGSFNRLLGLFNRQLGDLLLKGDGRRGGEMAQKRKFWNNAAVNFHHAFLATGRISPDEARSRPFDLLLNLHVFVDRYESSHFNEAASIMDSLDLMPRKQEDISKYIDAVQNHLDSSVRSNMPGLIVLFMECLSSTFLSLKSQLNRTSGTYQQEQEAALTTSLTQRLYEIRERAKVMVTFAGLISSDATQVNETSARLAKLQASMM